MEHKQLSDKHKLLQAELRDKGTLLCFIPHYVGTFVIYTFPFLPLPTFLPTLTAGAKDHVEELLKRIADIQGMTSSVLYFALDSFYTY